MEDDQVKFIQIVRDINTDEIIVAKEIYEGIHNPTHANDHAAR